MTASVGVWDLLLFFEVTEELEASKCEHQQKSD